MGASVGIGGLIIGVSMLVVFSMAYQSIALQIDSGIDRIEDADKPLPTFTLDNAELWEGAVVDIIINSGGAGYTDGTFEADPATGGLAGTFSTSGGAIDDVVITSHGNYTTAPTLKFDCTVSCSPTINAIYTVVLGNVVYANLTNTGSTTVHHDNMWLFVDGVNATPFSRVYTSPIGSELWFSGETLSLQWLNADIVGSNRLTLTAGSMTVSNTLV